MFNILINLIGTKLNTLESDLKVANIEAEKRLLLSKHKLAVMEREHGKIENSVKRIKESTNKTNQVKTNWEW